MPPPATRIGPTATVAWPATAALLAAGAAIASHVDLAFGHPDGALGLAALQAVAAATVVGLGLGRFTRRPTPLIAASLVAVCLLGSLALGARDGAAAGLAAMSGAAHALLYATLFLVFARTLRTGRVALVTMVASRVNPSFHAGMIPYTRAVTWAWAGLAAGQLLASVVLFATDRPLWTLLVTVVHLPLVAALALLELAIRHWRWRDETPTGLLETIRGTRRLMAQRDANRSTTS